MNAKEMIERVVSGDQPQKVVAEADPNTIRTIIDAMYRNPKIARMVSDKLNIPDDPDSAAEYLTMVPDAKLKEIVKLVIMATLKF